MTTDPVLGAIFLSEYINQRNHGILVAPWDVKELPEEYVYAYRALQKTVSKKQRKNKLESLFAEHRRRHKSYRKY